MVMRDAEKAELIERNIRRAKMMAPESPWNTFEPEKLGPAVMSYISSREPYFRRWAELWFSTFQFLFGNHNFKWSRKYGFAVDYDMLKSDTPNAQMRSYTNIARLAVESLTSMLYSNIPEWDAETINESSITGRKFKKICERLLEGMYMSINMDNDVSAAAFVMATFGQVATNARYDLLGGKVVEVNKYHPGQSPLLTSYMAPNAVTQGLIEVPTNVVDTTGQPYLDYLMKPERDIQGRQVVDRIYAGSPSVDVYTPFEYDRDIGTTGMHKTRSVRIYKLMDYDQWLDEYGLLEGKTKFFDQIQPVYASPQVHLFALRLFMRLQTVTPPEETSYGRFIGGMGTGLFKYKVLVIEHYDRPHPKKWPQGRRVVVSNGFCTHITKPQYNTEKMDGWHPLSEAQWMNCYPSSIASGPMQDVVRKNREINVKDSLIATALRRNMGSQLLVKMGMGIDPHQFIGEPGMAWEVTDPFGARWLHDDMPIPPVIAPLRQQDKEDIYEQTGALEAQRGEPSRGATSGYQEKQREEREEKRLAPARKAFRQMVASTGEKLLYAIKAQAPRLDDYTIGYLMRTSAGEFTTDDVVSFLTQPLPVGTQVKIVENSMAIKSKATEQATLAELARGPAQQRIAQDAKVLDKYLKSFDAEHLRDASAAHRDRAERENEAFMDMIKMGVGAPGITKPIVIDEDDNIIHMGEHDEFLITVWDQVRDNKEFLLEFYTHKEMHRLKELVKQGQLMPGAEMSTGAMVQQGAQTPLPSVQAIFQRSMMEKMQAQSQPQPPPGQSQQSPQPQGPRMPSEGPGPSPQNPETPSQNTQAGAQQQAQQGGPPNG